MALNNKNKLLGIVQKYLSKGQHQKALGEYRKILEATPEDSTIRLKVAELCERLGHQEEAIEEYHRVALNFSEKGFYPKAIAVLARIVGMDPKLKDVHLEIAELNQKVGRVAESVRHFQLAANIEHRKGEKRQSIDILKKIAELHPDNIEKRLEVAALYYKEGFDPEAYDQYCNSIKGLDPASQELLEWTQRILKAAPHDNRLRIKLAEIHLARKEPKLAVEVLEPATDDFRTARTVELLAEAKAEAEEIDEAKALLEEAIELYKSEWDPAKRRDLSARLMELSASAPGLEPSEGDAAQSGDTPAPPLRAEADDASRVRPAIEICEIDEPSSLATPQGEGGRRVAGAGESHSTSGQAKLPEGMSEDKHLDLVLAEADATFRKGNRAGAIAGLEEVAGLYPDRSDPLFRLLWIHDYSENWVGVADLSRRIGTLMKRRGDAARAARYYAEASTAEARIREADVLPPVPEAGSDAEGNAAAGESGASKGGSEKAVSGDDEREFDIVIDDEEPAGTPVSQNDGAQASGSSGLPSARFAANGELAGLLEQGSDGKNMKGMAKTVLSTAFRHALTGLPIRALFVDRLDQALSRAKRDKNYRFAVLVLDLDRFKLINDSLGHTVGDELLVAIARRLEETLRKGNTAAYLGGDEFTILLDEVRDPSDALRVAEQIRQRLAMPFNLRGQEVFTSASIGIALSTDAYDRAEELLRDADTAMYRAKAQGKARYEVFDQAMHARAMTLLELETDLRRAVERGEFRVHYQPIISLTSGKITGFEALARWLHPSGRLIPPMDFIPVAEEIALIIPIDRWILSQACHQLKVWQKAFPTDPALTMNVNLSGKHFAQSDLIDHIKLVLDQESVDPETLKLEITESVVMENVEEAHSILTELKKLKVKLNVDDFGTGHSSLAALHRFPFDTLKIDRAFVQVMQGKAENEEIVKTIISLGKNLGMSVVAEGIETQEQFARLRSLGCDFGQGFLFSRGIEAEDASTLLTEDPIW